MSFAIGTIAPSARAQEGAGADNTGAAIAIFEEARKHEQAGEYEAAVLGYQRMLSLVPSAPAMFRLGDCLQKLGRTGSAWTAFRRAAVQAKKDGKTEIETAAIDRAKALEPSLSKITVSATKVDGLVIKQNGQEIPLATLGIAIPADPGEVTIEATAPGYKPQSLKIALGDKADAKSVTIPPLEKEPMGIAPPDRAETGTTPPKGSPPADDSGSMKTVGYILGGVGIAGLGLGGAMGFLAMSDKSDAEDDPALCPDQKCTPAGRDKIDSAESKALISTIGFGVGAAALGAGIVILVMSGGDDKEASAGKSAQVLPSFDPNGGGLSVVGQF